MCDPTLILRLYSCVLHEHICENKISHAAIRTAIQNMKEVYKPNPGSLADEIVFVADYNDVGHRCAYLHKYAPFHTALVADMLKKVLLENPNLFYQIIKPSGCINICSLGGGPGSDIIGTLSVLNTAFGLFQASATVIDCMGNWKDTFHDLISELRYGDYRSLGECVQEQYFEWKYLQHNLLSKMTEQVNQAIGRANLVTMIKFVSASSCKDTSAMIKKIFRSMKHGSLVLYIDNAGGGFHQLLRKEAQVCNMITVFGPLKHELYVNHDYNVKRFGYTPCLETKVTVQIWRKASQNVNAYSNFPKPSAVVNVVPVAQPKTAQSKNFESNMAGQRVLHNVSGVPSRPANASHLTNSYQPSTYTSAPNYNFNSSLSNQYTRIPKQPSVRSQPQRISSTLPERERNNGGNRVVEDDSIREYDDCCNCCVIS